MPAALIEATVSDDREPTQLDRIERQLGEMRGDLNGRIGALERAVFGDHDARVREEQPGVIDRLAHFERWVRGQLTSLNGRLDDLSQITTGMDSHQSGRQQTHRLWIKLAGLIVSAAALTVAAWQVMG